VSNTTRRSKHENVLSLTQFGTCHEHPPRRSEDEWRGGGFLPRHAFGDANEVFGGNRDTFRMHTFDVFAQEVIVYAQRFVTVAAELALAARYACPDGDTVAFFETRLATFYDDTRCVASGYMGHVEADSGKTAPCPYVEMVQRSGFHVYENLAFLSRRFFAFGVFDNFTSSVFRELYGFHAHTLSVVPCSYSYLPGRKRTVPKE
jgi:hypothetical protein